MRSIGFAVAAIATVGLSTAAFADAVVSPVSGSVLVSQGQGFVRQVKPIDLKVGDRVMVAEGNRAKITYGDGCAVDLLPGAVQIVRTSSPCAYKAQFNPGGAAGTSFFAGANLAGIAVAGGVVALAAVSVSVSVSEKNTKQSSPPMSP